jgi:hypothetical protein
MLPAQWSGDSFAVGGLPLPADMSLAAIEAGHGAEEFVKDALSLPGLEALMEDAARNTEPVSMDSLPLATGPQDVPDAIDDGAVVSTGTAWSSPVGWLGQMFFDSTPQGTWDSKVIDIAWFCVMLVLVQNAPRGMVVLVKHTFPQGASSFQGILFFG